MKKITENDIKNNRNEEKRKVIITIHCLRNHRVAFTYNKIKSCHYFVQTITKNDSILWQTQDKTDNFFGQMQRN